MKIWLVNIGEQIPSDPGTPRLLRTGILAQHLAQRGHDVTWWNSTVNHQEKIQRSSKTVIQKKTDNYRLILLYGTLYHKNISFTRILSHVQNAREFRRIAPQQEQPDLILCGYPSIELARAITGYGQEHNIPVIIDFRDMWPDIFEEHIPKQLRSLSAVLLKPWRKSLNYTVRHATAITGITDHFVDWALSQTQRVRTPKDRAFHLAVNPVSSDAKDLAQAADYWDHHGITEGADKIIGCYTGIISSRLDIETFILGCQRLPDHLKQKVRLVFCGRGDALKDLTSIALKENHIIFAGWRNAAELQVLLNRSNFGILPYPSSQDFMMSFPNKVGEYFSKGLPIITCLEGQTKKLLLQHGIGYFYQENNPETVAVCLQQMIEQQDAFSVQEKEAKKVFHDLFDGEHIYPEFCDYLEKMSGLYH